MQKIAKITLGTLASICLFLAYGGIGAIETGSMGIWYMGPVMGYIAAAAILGRIACKIGRKQNGRYDGCKAVQKMPLVARTKLDREAL